MATRKGDTPPQRTAKRTPGRKPRQPKIKADERASVGKAARELAKEVNGELEKLRQERPSKNYSPEERRRRNQLRTERNRKKRMRNGEAQPKCKGRTLKGTPCGLAPLLPENWDGPNEPTGLYCVHHDPNITNDETEAYLLHGSANKPIPRKITAGEAAHRVIQRAPHYILRPYLKALGLRLNEDGELEEAGTGLKLYGYSRGGEVIRSRYPDLVGQTQVAEKLLDRVYGKPRAAVDLASQNTTVNVHVQMDEERVSKVSEVLTQAGVLPNGNGNGHHLIEATAEDLPLDDEPS